MGKEEGSEAMSEIINHGKLSIEQLIDALRDGEYTYDGSHVVGSRYNLASVLKKRIKELEDKYQTSIDIIRSFKDGKPKDGECIK